MTRREDSVSLLLERGANVNARGVHETTALMRAVAGGHVGTVHLLLNAGASPTSRDDAGNSARSLAREAKNPELAELIENSSTGLRKIFL